MSVHFSSERQDYGTPQSLFDFLDAEFKFTLDAFASSENAKCPTYFTKEQDALSQDWGEHIVFMNPEYKHLRAAIEKAHGAAQAGATVVALIPARTCTRAWHDHIMHANEIRFLRGRLTFEGASQPAPFPSCIVVFRPPGTWSSGNPDLQYRLARTSRAPRWTRVIFTEDS